MGLLGSFFKPPKATVYKTQKGEDIDIRQINSPFDLSTLRERPEGDHFYLLDQKNTEAALVFLPVMNEAIKEAKRLHKAIPGRKFTEKQFEKTIIKLDDCDQYVLQLSFNPLTKAKQEISKYPLSVFYNPSKDLFACVDFTQDGNIGKMEITVWGKICYIVNAAYSNGMLTIKAIYENAMGYKTKVYPQ